jgi:hypothetical protein
MEIGFLDMLAMIISERAVFSLLLYVGLYPARYIISLGLETWIVQRKRPIFIKAFVAFLLFILRTRTQRRDAWVRRKVREHFHIEDKLMGI